MFSFFTDTSTRKSSHAPEYPPATCHRVLVLGDNGVGKTTLLLRICDPSLWADAQVAPEPTIGCRIHLHEPTPKQRIAFLDVGGGLHFHPRARSAYYQDIEVCVLVASAHSERTIQSLWAWWEDYLEARVINPEECADVEAVWGMVPRRIPVLILLLQHNHHTCQWLHVLHRVMDAVLQVLIFILSLLMWLPRPRHTVPYSAQRVIQKMQEHVGAIVLPVHPEDAATVHRFVDTLTKLLG